jgi:hypothetical protein
MPDSSLRISWLSSRDQKSGAAVSDSSSAARAFEAGRSKTVLQFLFQEPQFFQYGNIERANRGTPRRALFFSLRHDRYFPS